VFKTADGHINIASTGLEDMGRGSANTANATELMQRPEYQNRRRGARSTRDARSMRIWRNIRSRRTSAGVDRTAQQSRGFPGGADLHDSTRSTPTRRSVHLGIAQAGLRPRNKSTLRHGPASRLSLSRTPSPWFRGARRPELGEANTDTILKEFGFSAEANCRAAQGECWFDELELVGAKAAEEQAMETT